MSLIKEYQSLTNQKVSLVKFLDMFSNEDECLQLYFDLKYSECGCPKCGRNMAANYKRISGKNKNGVQKKSFRCRSCHTSIYPLSDTVFKGSTIPIHHIFFTIFMLVISKSNISALEVANNINVSYKTAHRLVMLIRHVLGEIHGEKMKGVVEVDEAFFGGGSKVYNWSSMSTRKQPIIGLVERGTGKVRMFLVDNRNAKTIKKLLLDNIETGSTVYTDSWRGYNGLEHYYRHEAVDHSKREFVRGEVHTNTIENIWGQFKRRIRKTHIKISAKYVQLYVNEACWRHNSKGKHPMELFNEVLVRTFVSKASGI